ncbi:hypothetical protein ACHAXT_009253 [Thalassiosira profunda]
MQHVAVPLLLAAVGHAFSPPAATTSLGGRQLQYVRHEEGMGWPINEVLATTDGEHQHQDYEARVERRFSRYRRRERLRNALSYGAEMDWQRRELEEAHRRHVDEMRSHPAPPRMVNRPVPIVNFRTNSDFPASDLPASRWGQVAAHPVEFDDAEYSHCTRSTRHVLVPRKGNEIPGTRGGDAVTFNGYDYEVRTVDDVLVQQTDPSQPSARRAYWLQDKLQGAIYGQVRYGTILRKLESPVQVRLPPKSSSSTSKEGDFPTEREWVTVEWIATDDRVAVKELNWEHIRTEGQKLAEDPIKEVAAMQHLKRWADREAERRGRLPEEMEGKVTADLDNHHIVMPLDLLSDDENLYSITPYCTGGRLLDMVEGKSRFSEPEARYWMKQILKGLTCLKKAGVSHRDMSPENLMVHEGNVYIIDLGMCLRIPHTEQGRRALILPQTPCGKWYYLSPEVLLSEQPFDGPAVDLWAAAVILFIMLTGTPPWDEPKMTDEAFKLTSTGFLEQMLTERHAGLSADAMDLLQRMLWLDPADRLSLEQVCAHPWMAHDETLGPGATLP